MRWRDVAVASLLLGGCGDSSGDGTGSTGDVSSGPSTSAPTATESGPSTSATGSSGTSDETSTSMSTGTDDATGTGGDTPVELEGYGTTSTFGAGGESCVVTNLDDAGVGSLRDCVENRDTTDDNPTPREVTFEIGGTINLVEDIRIRQPFLTVDGLSAPAPGITIEKTGNGADGETIINTWSGNATCGHDVLVQGIRFQGVWPGDSEDHMQNAATIAIDGEDLPLCLRNVVLNRITVIDAQDSGGDIWGSIHDVTVQYSAFLVSLHPNTYSHAPGDVPDQQRERLSNHHNLYAMTHERGPQVRGNVWDANFEQNIMHKWAGFGFPGGYGSRFRLRDGAYPQRINLIENHWTSGGANLSEALILGDVSGAGDDGPIAGEVYMSGNRLPPENVDAGTAPAEFPRPAEAEVTLFPDDQLASEVLPRIGVPYRTAEEDAIFAEVAAQVESDG